MLAVRPAQVRPLQAAGEQQFRAALCKTLVEDFQWTAQLAPSVLDPIVGYALGRAACYGLSSPSALGRFVGLMAGLGPAFDQHPVVHALLVGSGLNEDARLDALAERVPDSVWTEIEHTPGNVGWFWSRDVFESDPVTSVSAALDHALPAETSRQAGSAWLRERCVEAVRHGWRSIDGCFVFSAAALLFGSGFDSRGRVNPWVHDVFSSPHARIQIALLRIRIALEHGIWL